MMGRLTTPQFLCYCQVHLLAVIKLHEKRPNWNASATKTHIIGHITLVAIAGTTILIPYLKVKSLQLIWRSGTNLQISCSDFSHFTTWGGTGILTLAMGARQHAPFALIYHDSQCLPQYVLSIFALYVSHIYHLHCLHNNMPDVCV